MHMTHAQHAARFEAEEAELDSDQLATWPRAQYCPHGVAYGRRPIECAVCTPIVAPKTQASISDAA